MGMFAALKRWFATPRSEPGPAAPEASGAVARPAPAPAPARSLSPAQRLFMEEAARIAQELDDVRSIEQDADQFALRMDIGGRSHAVFLGNVFVESRELPPEERAGRVLGLLTAMQASEEEATWSDARTRLLPVLRACTFGLHDMADPEADDPEKVLVRWEVLPFLAEMIALDREHSMAYVNRSQLAGWEVSPELARKAAFENLARGERAIEPYDPQASYPIWHALVEDEAYTASCLLVPGWLQSFADKVHGRPVAAVPERATVVVTGDASEAGLARLIELAEREFAASPRAISPALYTVGAAGAVVPLELPREHPLAAPVRLAHLRLAAGEYAFQAELLNKRHEREGVDLFVASVSIVERKGGVPVSYCVWGEGVDCLLPRTDVVIFAGGEKPDNWHFVLRWSEVAELAGGCWQPVADLSPPRMRTTRWPDGALLAALRKRAIELDQA